MRSDRHSGCDDCLLSQMLYTHQQAMLDSTGLLMLDSPLPYALRRHALYVQETQDLLIPHTRSTHAYVHRANTACQTAYTSS